ncbi:hypothetical protein Lal_00049247 [Lupinus albus]|nr:hypothetical protein Lal_00049247 [Lupinus albus]
MEKRTSMLGKACWGAGGSPMARHPDPPRSSRNIIHKHFQSYVHVRSRHLPQMIFNRRAAQSMMP